MLILRVISVTTLIGNKVAEINSCLNVDIWIESLVIFADNRFGQQARNRHGLTATWHELRGRTHHKNEASLLRLAIIATLAFTDVVTVPRSGSSRKTPFLGEAQ
jgi:hypothetical protein